MKIVMKLAMTFGSHFTCRRLSDSYQFQIRKLVL